MKTEGSGPPPETAGKSPYEGRFGACRQCQREEGAEWYTAHGAHIAGIRCGELVAQGVGRRLREVEVDPFGQQVGGDQEPATRGRPQESGVVTDPEVHGPGRSSSKPPEEIYDPLFTEV